MKNWKDVDVDDFLTRLTLAIQECTYKVIAPNKVEEAMLIQTLIMGVQAETARENFIVKRHDLSWEFKEFVENNGIRHLTMALYHIVSNGLVERAV